jgi:hypothetical protein
MNSFVLVLSLFGYGVGFEGVDGDRVYIGTYTPQKEYGWVVQNGEVWLDVVVEKNEKKTQEKG